MSSTPETRLTRGSVTRDQVLAVAAELFARNGYKATNLGLVAERLGVTRQALYYHFTRKSDILAALFDALMGALEDAVVSAEAEPGEARFSAIVSAYLQVTVENVDLTAVLLHERPEMNKIEALGAPRRRRRIMDRIIDAYREGVEEGQLRDVDPRTAANMIIAALNSVSWWYRQPSPATEVDLRPPEDVITLLLHGVDSA